MTDVIKSVKGTRDFYPLEKGILTWLYTNIREVSEQFGYQEYEGNFSTFSKTPNSFPSNGINFPANS